MTTLVIVESPGKLKKIREYLGTGYTVAASFGHVRDLPERGELGVRITQDTVTPQYEVTSRGQKAVAELKRHAKHAERIILASDADREGEAIAWHISQVLGRKHRYQRAVFTEITRDAIRKAVQQPRPLDERLVDAQQARRVLDRLVGWMVSPTLQQGTGNPAAKSAGRVQTPAVRLVVTREREIQAFVAKTYYAIDAGLTAPGKEPVFRARMTEWHGTEVGQSLTDLRVVEDLVARCKRMTQWWVDQVEQKPSLRRPPPPFTTSTLQQAASVALKWKPSATMAVAQRLYEAGAITYMRTDSVHLSDEAVQQVRAFIAAQFPPVYLPAAPVVHTTTNQAAQEAHECIRVVDLHRIPDAFSGEDRALYELIHRRTIACQMAAAQDRTVSIGVAAGDDRQRPESRFLARGTVTVFDGWRRAARVAEDDDADRELGDPTDGTGALPAVVAGELLRLGVIGPVKRTTKPPPRYTEASLIKALDKLGIGRPSTYATIMSTILDRGYVGEQKGKLLATDLGSQVVDYLVRTFSGHMADIAFTARVEEQLDGIAAGKIAWQPAVAAFGWELRDRARAAGLRSDPLASAPPSATSQNEAAPLCPVCAKAMRRRDGRFGPFFSCTGYPRCKGTRPA